MSEQGGPRRVGLPGGTAAVLFDLDGVLTATAKVHAVAWKQMFDGFLRTRAEAAGQTLVPFDLRVDYDRYVDGKPRDDGTRAFLASRGIHLPEGSPQDSPGENTVAGLGRLKNDLVLAVIRDEGVEVYPGSVRYLDACRSVGLSVAVVSSSANTRAVLAVTGLAGRVEVIVDAGLARDRHLAGKPAPDTFLAAAGLLGVSPDTCAVFEDALAGVEAARAGAFGFVVGVDRVGHGAALARHGADIVVTDLADLLPGHDQGSAVIEVEP